MPAGLTRCTALLSQLTLWGELATGNIGQQLEQAMAAGAHPILSVKGVRVGDYSGKSLSTLNTSILEIDPDIPQAGILRSWYAEGRGPCHTP